MNTMYLILFAVVVLAVFLALRWLIKHPLQFPNLGRITAALLLTGGTLLDQLNVLPWGTILADGQAKMVGFAIAVGMMILHVKDMVGAQLNPPAPPTGST